MGLKEKAFHYRKESIFENFENLNNLVKNNIISKEELLIIKEALNDKINNAKEKLDRKIIDLQTLFEISKELNSNLKIYDLIQILIFTIIGHFDVKDVAVYSFKNNKFVLLDKKGFYDIENNIEDSNFINELESKENIISQKNLQKYSNLKVIASSEFITILKIKESKIIGFIAFGKKNNNKIYNEEELNFAQALTSMAAVAIENANLYENLKNAYDVIDKKYNELSTLYEISKIINSTNDYDLIISLIIETLCTGFGLRKGLLFLKEENSFIIRNVIGLDSQLINKTIELSNEEKYLIKENKCDILPIQKQKFNINELFSNYLFIPLVTGGSEVGGIIIYSFDYYEIDKKNEELLSLMTIIASQIAPPLLMAILLKKEKDRIIDPFNPLLDIIENEIKNIKDWHVSLIFTVLYFENFKNYILNYQYNLYFTKIEDFIKKIRKEIPSTSIIYHYSSNKIFIIFRGITEVDFNEILDVIYDNSKKVFDNYDMGLRIKKVFYNEDLDKYKIITELE